MKFSIIDLFIAIHGTIGFAILSIETDHSWRSLLGISYNYDHGYNYFARIEISICFRIFGFKKKEKE